MSRINKRIALLGRLLRETSRKSSCREYGLLLECSYIMLDVWDDRPVDRIKLEEVCTGLYNRLCEIEKAKRL